MFKDQRKAQSNKEVLHMGISDVIASFIQSALDETDGVLEL